MEITTTGMKIEYYNAAMEGKIDAFEEKSGEQIESILTPNKNTILHIHFTNYTESVSETFVEEVLAMCPALLLKTNVKDETILHIAARYGHHEIVRKLIERAKVLTGDFNRVGAKERLIRALNDKKDTALHEAARYGHTEVVGVLTTEEPDHSYFGQNDGGETPLYIAIERRKWDVVDTILENSNSPQYNGPNGRNALHAAIIFDDTDGEIVSKLLMRKLSLAKQADKNGWVPLHLAVLVGGSKIVELLVSEDRSTAYMRDNKGRTALHLAALCGDVKAMEKILEYCPDCCELVDEKGCNALHCTTLMDKGSCVDETVFEQEKKILKNAPLMRNLSNEKDDDGNTPLHYIARLAPKCETYFGHALLEPQFSIVVDTMACNKDSQNPLDVASAHMTPDSAFENKLFRKLQDIGAMFGGRILDKHLREKKQEKRHDPAVDEKEKENKTNEGKENKTNGENDLRSGIAKSLSIVATLIATVTFAAGFTLPGGLSQDKGSPILKYNAAFIAFVITDSLSFIDSTFVILLLFYLSLACKEGEKGKDLYDLLLSYCSMLTASAMGFMIIAFGTGLYAVLGVSKGFGIVILCMVLLFLFNVFMLIHKVHRRALEFVIEGKRRTRELGQERSAKSSYIRNNYPLFRVRDVQLSHIV